MRPTVRLSSTAWGWIGPIGVALFAFALRIWNVGYPKTLMFDETYYAKHAYSQLKFGYVQGFVDDANDKIVAGNLDGIFTGEPDQITHPEAGKWLIALGEWAFGFNPFGWRIAAVVIGALTVLVVARLVRRLTGSTVIGCVAGLLLTFDGMHFVMSRIALLDVFLTFWIVCAVACLVADRDWMVARIDRYRFVRPWQLLAGVCFGLAMGTKWSGLYALAAFGLLAVAWEVVARRRHWNIELEHRHGRRPGWITSTLVVGVPAFITIVGIAAIVYIATWSGWLLHHGAYEQKFGYGYGDSAAWGSYIDRSSANPFIGFIDALRSLWHYHQMTWDFHTGNYLAGVTHPYQSDALRWLILERPVASDAQNDLPAAICGAPDGSSCMREVLILGNPVLWWTGAVALLAASVQWILTRDWRWSVPIVGVLSGWVPWFFAGSRPIFSFYAVVIIPFTIIAICLVIDVARKAVTTPRARYALWVATGSFMTAVIVAFWYFHPIYTDDLVRYDDWYRRMWFDRWI